MSRGFSITYPRTGLAAASLVLLLSTGVHAQDRISIGGEVRVRPEAERPAATDTFDVFGLLRARLHLGARLAPGTHVFVQVQDARTFGEEAGTTDGTADRLDMHQAWLQYGDAGRSYAWSVRAGRQEVVFGNERLIGAAGWTQTGRAVDGVRFTAGPKRDRWNVSALAAVVGERGRRVLPDSEERSDQLLLGAMFDTRLLELLVLHDNAAEHRVWSDIDRTTAYGRLMPRAGPFAFSLEGAYQLGDQLGLFDDILENQDIRAWMLGMRLGWSRPRGHAPQLGIGIDVLSGDEEPTGPTYSAFNTLYATNHRFYGYIDFFLDPAARTQDRGLIDGLASASLRLARNVTLGLDGHAFWLMEELPATSDRFIGWEADLTLPVSLGDGQLLQLGYSVFRNGAAAEFLGLGGEDDWSHWGYIQASFGFGGGPPPLIRD